MQEIRAKVIEHLTADETLHPDMVPGGIYDRPLKPGGGRGSTPDAFYKNPGDPANLWHIRESIVVMGPNDVDPADGPVRTEDIVLRDAFFRLFYYVPTTSTGKQHLDQIDARVRWLLHPDRWQPILTTGYPLTVEPLEMIEAVDSDEFDGALVCFRRFRGEYLRAAA